MQLVLGVTEKTKSIPHIHLSVMIGPLLQHVFCVCLEVCQRSIFAASIVGKSQWDPLFFHRVFPCCKREFNSHGEFMLDSRLRTEIARAKVQKIEELERQNAGLEQDLELLRSSEPLGAEVLTW